MNKLTKYLISPFLNEAPRVPRKKGQHRGSKSHSDLYTDENPKGTIKGLKFATVKDAEASVRKIKSSGRSHAHKIQAAVAMEQRAREMGKKSQAAVYRRYINKMKEKTKKKNEDINIPVKIGDTILTGRFKNKKVVVKSIDKDEHGMPTINGKKITTFRVLNTEGLKEMGITDFKSLFKKMPSDLQKRVYNLKNFGQRVDKHPEGNVLKHTITVVNRSIKEDDIDIAIAAMFHDIGKDETAGIHPKKGHITHFGHEKVSASLVKKYRNWIESVGGNTANIFYIVKNHTKYKQLDNMRIKKVMKLKAFRAFDKLSKFSKHDRGGLGEGVNDPGILKAVFLAGGPGSGKTYVTRGLFGIPKSITLSAYGLKVVNSDTELERMLDKYGFGTDLDAMPDELFKQLTDPDYEDYSGLRTRAKELTAARKKLYMDGRLGLIIDGTGDTFSKIKKQKKELEDIGYDCFMVFVHTKLEVAQQRNMERKRKLKPKLVSDSWNAVQANKGAYQGLFGASNFLLVDNSKTLDEDAAQKKFEMLVKKGVSKFIKKPVKNFKGKNWIKKQKIMKESFSFDGTIPSPSRKLVKKMKKKGNTSVPYGSGYEKIKEQKQIKKVVGIYGGRFQPFGPHHKKTYEWLKSRVDDAYITTSNIKQPPRHPMDFKEKVRHMVKMGIPKNRIIQEKSPYVAKNVLKKYDKDTTAVVYIFGAKDAGRLKGGKYFQDYKKNKDNFKGYEENGYVLTAPHQSVKVAGNEVSGTVMRQLLGSPNYEEDREKLFKKAFGYFDKGIYNMMTNKFKKLFEEFKLSDELIKEFLLEASGTVLSPTDDGPPTFHRGFSDYKKYSKKWLDEMYAGAGWEIVNYILGKNAINPDFDYTLSYSTVPAIAYGTKQSGEYGSRFGVDNPIEEYKKYINDTVLRNLGYEVIKWMGITPDGRNYTGVNVETPVVGGVGSDNVANTEIDKLDLKEINLDEEVKLIVEGGAYGHMNHPFDDKNLTFSDLKQIIINGLGGNLNREDNVTEKLDGQNLMISWVNGKLVTARNKGQLKNYGQTAMDTAGVASKFAGRGDIKNAFVFAMKDLSKAVGRLSAKQKEKVFGNGKRWMNLEVIYPASANVIDYDKSEIIFHGTLEYDESGRAIGQPKDSARMLAGMIKQVNQNVQKKYSIGKPVFLNVPKIQNFDSKKQGFLSRLDRLKRQFALKDNDTLGRYHQAFWEEFIFNAGQQYGYDIPNKILINLTKRWAFFDKSYSVQDMRKEIDNEDFLDWALSFDKTDHVKYVKDNMKPFEVLFLDVGAQILKNMSGFLVASPDKAVQKIRKDVVRAINTVKKSKDVKKINTLKAQIEKLEKIGGLSSIVPSEGIVFKYKGNTYKFTGAFAPVNQIVGLLNF